MPTSSSEPTAGPTAEALALSASLFTSTIASWIPANFGATKSDTDKAADFELVLREERGGRLGLGHPLIDAPYKAAGPSRGGGLGDLSRKVASERKGKERKEASDALDADVEEEEESRAKSLGKARKKESAMDMFGGKKKKKVDAVNQEHPMAAQARARVIKSPLPQSPPPRNTLSQTPAEDEDEDDHPLFSPSRVSERETTPSTPPPLSSPGGSGIFPFSGPLALESPVAKRMMDERLARKRKVDVGDESGGEEASIGLKAEENQEESQGTPTKDGKKSKTMLRREARKRAKMGKAQ